LKTSEIIELDNNFGAHNYHPLPVVIATAKGIKVTDPEGVEYFDFLSAYSAVNQGHLHPHIINALKLQLERCTLTSRAFHNDRMGTFLEKLCSYTGYEAALPMNTGAEAVETALKLARRWGVEKKGVKNGEQEIIVVEGNFHGRTITIVSFSTDEDSRVNYGPYTPGFKVVPYNDSKAIEKAITKNTVAVLLEPIQGEAGVVIPDDGYLKNIRKLCDDHNMLMMVDEVQTGFCRTGKKFATDYEGVKADVMILGKALGAGVIPVSAIVANKKFMNVFTPGTHGSTFGGYPVAAAVGIASLEVLEQENLAENSYQMGVIFRRELEKAPCSAKVEVRGKGLLNAVVFKPGFNAWELCLKLKDHGLLAKQTHGNIIRFAPPLVIKEKEMLEAINIIKTVMSKY
jgi:ornithine--oxo-acid transaminase